MPLYEYQCADCGALHTAFQRVAHCNEPGPVCCGSPTRRIISLPRFSIPFEPYESPISGKVIRTKSEREDDLRRHNCRPWEGFETEKQEAARNRQYRDQVEESRLEAALVEAYQRLPEDQQVALDRYVPGAPSNMSEGMPDTDECRVYS